MQQLIQNFINDYPQNQVFRQPNQETIAAIEAVERGEVEKISIEELRKLAQEKGEDHGH